MARTLGRTSSYSRGCQKILTTAVSQVTIDVGFDIPTAPAKNARMCAEKLLGWLSGSTSSGSDARTIVGLLESCFYESRSIRVARERMWENYYKLRSSNHFKEAWSELLRKIECQACPIFYQFVTEKMMEWLIMEHFPLGVQNHSISVAPLDFEEVSALRYTAGYVIHALQKKVQRSAHPLKKDILWCLEEIVENEGFERAHCSEEWVDLVDRGGLIHISDKMYAFFHSMEMELRVHLRASASVGVKEKAVKGILENEDVVAHWDDISWSWGRQEAEQLLQMIIEHWVTVRGFSFTSSFMEKYKQVQKKTVQKSKGLRKNLMGASTEAAAAAASTEH